MPTVRRSNSTAKRWLCTEYLQCGRCEAGSAAAGAEDFALPVSGEAPRRGSARALEGPGLSRTHAGGQGVSLVPCCCPGGFRNGFPNGGNVQSCPRYGAAGAGFKAAGRALAFVLRARHVHRGERSNGAAVHGRRGGCCRP
jgi:hypothetical protein